MSYRTIRTGFAALALSSLAAAAFAKRSASAVFLFSASATYHLVNAGPKVTKILRKLDHSAIYLLIAGTYTPFCLIAFNGFWKWGLLSIIWVLALIGIITKIFVNHAHAG